MQYYDFRAMNTDIVLAAEGKPDTLSNGLAATRRFIENHEARLTRFSETSELAALNRSGGRPFVASPMLFEIVREAVVGNEKTGGLFDPTVLDALEAAGYDRSMDDVQAGGAGPRRPTQTARWSCQDIGCDELTHTILLPPGLHLDLGGIAKGWIAEGACRLLARYSSACAVNAGGDMVVTGVPEGQSHWLVALEDPRDANNILAILRIGPGAVATSSVTRRRWLQDGQPQHHLIDPRRGAPAQTDWLSVTAIAASALDAEVFAKALLIAGSHEGPLLAAKRPDIAFIAVDESGRLWGSANAREYIDGGLANV